MTRSRRDGRFLLMLGSAVFLFLGTAMQRSAPLAGWDFRLVYNSGRCLLRHVDPYAEREYTRVYLEDGGTLPDAIRGPVFSESMRYPYLPTAFVVFPLALLPFGPAHILWLAIIAVSCILASTLMWDLAAEFAPVLSGALIAILLASSEMLLVHCNPAAIAIPLCLIAVWCFVRQRFVAAGVLCLALSLALKPQDAAFVWLYFLLAGGVYRKRALQTLLAGAILCLPLLLWVTHVAPNWPQELHSNLASITAHGHANDPGPASMSIPGIGMIISLQSALSTISDNTRFYNTTTYLVCGLLLLLWSLTTFKSRLEPKRTWLALAAIAALSLLPFYHRLYDTRLLLLAVPACAMLCAEGGRIARLAVTLTTAAVLLTGDIQWVLFTRFLQHTASKPVKLNVETVRLVQVFPVLALLTTAVFYLWLYVRRTPEMPTPQPHTDG